MDELRGMYELPFLSHFLNTKRDLFKFSTIDVRVSFTKFCCYFKLGKQLWYGRCLCLLWSDTQLQNKV